MSSNLTTSDNNDDKWGVAGPTDDNIPPQIARLSSPGYKTFLDDHEALLPNKNVPQSGFNDDGFNDIIGPGPESQASLDTIKASIAALRPYLLKRLREKLQVVQVLEIFPSGESGYKSTMTLSQLLSFIHSEVVNIDNVAYAKLFGAQNEANANNANVSEDGSNDSPKEDGESSGNSKDGSGDGDEDSKDNKVDQSKSIPNYQKIRREKSTVAMYGLDQTSYRHIREIQYHDLRHLEHQFNPHEEPTVLLRRHAVLMSLNPLRAVITADKLVLIVPNGADSLLYLLHEHMHSIVEDDDVFGTGNTSSFEIRAYKAMLATVTSLHTQEYISCNSKVERILSKFRNLNSITVEFQEHLRMLKNTVSSQLVKTNAYRRLFKDLVDNDDDVALMNLSLLKEKPNLYIKPLQPEICNAHEELSILIESYLMDYNTLESKLQFLKAQITNAEELMSFRLDTARNELLIVDMSLAIVMCTLAGGTYVSSLFGMNLVSGVETDDWWFVSVSVAVSVLIIISTLILFNHYKLTGTIPFPIMPGAGRGLGRGKGVPDLI